jgi:uncharacterized damage-inducible protein DinB
VDFLVRQYLPKIERCLAELSDEQVWWRPNQASNSIGNLVLHLCGNARQWIIAGLGGAPDTRTRDAEFSQTEAIPRNELLALLRSTVAHVEEVLNTLNPDILLEPRLIQGVEIDVLRAVFHVTEHFSTHTGQIVLLTKLLSNKDLGFYDFSTGVPMHRW